MDCMRRGPLCGPLGTSPPLLMCNPLMYRILVTCQSFVLMSFGGCSTLGRTVDRPPFCWILVILSGCPGWIQCEYQEVAETKKLNTFQLCYLRFNVIKNICLALFVITDVFKMKTCNFWNAILLTTRYKSEPGPASSATKRGSFQNGCDASASVGTASLSLCAYSPNGNVGDGGDDAGGRRMYCACDSSEAAQHENAMVGFTLAPRTEPNIDLARVAAQSDLYQLFLSSPFHASKSISSKNFIMKHF